MFVAVMTLQLLLDTDELRVFNKLNEKEIIYSEMKKEITGLFDIVGLMYKYKKTTPDLLKDQSEVDKQRLLIKIRTHQLNDRKRLIGINQESTEQLLIEFEKHLDMNMSECINNTLKIVQCEKKFYYLSTKQVEIEEDCNYSKIMANKISNLSSLMVILDTVGNLQNLHNLEGGRLLNMKTLRHNYKKYFANLRFHRKKIIKNKKSGNHNFNLKMKKSNTE